MAGGVSIRVVDVSRGVVAAWMRVELYALAPDRRPIASGIVSAKGVVEEPLLAQRFAPGAYEAVFHVAAYYRAVGLALPRIPFLDVIAYRFGIDDPDSHYALQMNVTPWGYSCFRGGA